MLPLLATRHEINLTLSAFVCRLHIRIKLPGLGSPAAGISIADAVDECMIFNVSHCCVHFVFGQTNEDWLSALLTE